MSASPTCWGRLFAEFLGSVRVSALDIVSSAASSCYVLSETSWPVIKLVSAWSLGFTTESHILNTARLSGQITISAIAIKVLTCAHI
jgi:hypothetical protein